MRRSIFTEFYSFAMHTGYINNTEYINFSLQLLLYSILHGSVFHLLFNMFYIHYFWNLVEEKINSKFFIYFFLFSTLFTAWLLLLFSRGSTIGISWFWLALVVFYTLFLYYKWDIQYRAGITATIVLIAFWLFPGISFIWHFAWAFSGVIFYYIYKYILLR